MSSIRIPARKGRYAFDTHASSPVYPAFYTPSSLRFSSVNLCSLDSYRGTFTHAALSPLSLARFNLSFAPPDSRSGHLLLPIIPSVLSAFARPGVCLLFGLSVLLAPILLVLE